MHAALTWTAAALCIQVAASDLYARRVPNRSLVLALGIGAACLTLLQPEAWPHALAGLACAAVLLPFYALGWMGAGDVKFFAVLGFLLGAPALLPIWVIASVLAGAHAFAQLLAPRLLGLAPLALRLPVQDSCARLAQSSFHQRMRAARGKRQGIPYAAYLGFAALLMLLRSWQG
jgi:prepilin peptidase CpaA